MARETSSTRKELPEGAYQALEQFRIHSSKEPETTENLEPARGPSSAASTWIRRWKLPILLLIASI
ncbi:MAG: hypothetical protein ACKO3V_01525, partial [Pirellula sp.]